jgi:hypothetical protein
LDRAYKYGLRNKDKNEIINICKNVFEFGKNKLKVTQQVTNNATPRAYETYIAP